MTFNVHGGRDVEAIAAAIRDNPSLREGDVFLLQEIRRYEGEGTSRARRLARALRLGYVYAPARWMPDGSTQGQAILARAPLGDVAVVPLPRYRLPRTSGQRNALEATLATPGWPALRITNVHLDTVINFGARMAQLAPALERAARHPAAIVAGDFNTNRFCWLFHQLPLPFCDQARALDRRMRAAGYDAPTAASGPTARAPIVRLRLDGLYPRGLAVAAFAVERSVRVSDHLPVWIDVVPV